MEECSSRRRGKKRRGDFYEAIIIYIVHAERRDGIHKSYRLSLSSLSFSSTLLVHSSDVSSFGQRYDDSMCLYVFLILGRVASSKLS